MMPDIFVILLFAIPIGVIFWAGAIALILMLIDKGSDVIFDAKRRWRDRE